MCERGSGEIFHLHKFRLDSSIYLLEKNIQANALTFVNIFYFSVRLLAICQYQKTRTVLCLVFCL